MSNTNCKKDKKCQTCMLSLQNTQKSCQASMSPMPSLMSTDTQNITKHQLPPKP